MTVVLDASAGMEISLARKGSAPLAEALGNASAVITSDLYRAETGNALWKYHKAGLLRREDVLRCLMRCDELIDEYVDMSVNIEEALLEAVRLGHPVYDLLYFTLARRNGATLLTMDARLKRLARENGIAVI